MFAHKNVEVNLIRLEHNLPSFKNKKIKELHLGLTHKCVLQCSECARTYQTGPTRDLLDWTKYKQVIDRSTVIFLCGNWGDPIYYSKLFELCSYIKKKSWWQKQGPRSILMHTNGTGQIPEWWSKFGSILDERDNIFFSIDGTLSSSANYRINSNRISIVNGIIHLRSVCSAQLVWKHLVFAYNIDTVGTVIDQARALKFDRVEFVHAFTDNKPENYVEWNVEDVTSRIYQHFKYLEDIHHTTIDKLLPIESGEDEWDKWIKVDLRYWPSASPENI